MKRFKFLKQFLHNIFVTAKPFQGGPTGFEKAFSTEKKTETIEQKTDSLAAFLFGKIQALRCLFVEPIPLYPVKRLRIRLIVDPILKILGSFLFSLPPTTKIFESKFP